MATAKMKGSTFPRYEQNRFFSFPVVKKALSLLPGRAHQSLSEGHLEAKEKKKSKLLGPELFSLFDLIEGEIYFSTKKEQILFLEEGCAPSFIFFLLVCVTSSSRRPLFCV